MGTGKQVQATNLLMVLLQLAGGWTLGKVNPTFLSYQRQALSMRKLGALITDMETCFLNFRSFPNVVSTGCLNSSTKPSLKAVEVPGDQP